MLEVPGLIQTTFTLKPCVYAYVREEPSEKGGKVLRYYKEDRVSFKEPSKIYGDYGLKAAHIFNYFYNRGTSVAAILVGEAGSGKTLTSELICNMAIRNGYPVIYISGIRLNEDDLKFLYQLDNCVILIDEFGKMVNRGTQEAMLSMLTDKNKSILYLLTENYEDYIYTFFKSRPGRVRYFIRYGKLPINVLEEYLQDHYVTPEFKDDLIAGYKEADTFTFDHLEALVQEHKFSPNMTLRDMIEILNVKNLETVYYIKLVNIEYLGKHIPLMRSPKPTKENEDTQFRDSRLANAKVQNIMGKAYLNLVGTKFVAIDNSRSYTDTALRLNANLDTMYLPIDVEETTYGSSGGVRRTSSYGISQSCFRYIIDNPDIFNIDCKATGLNNIPDTEEDKDISNITEEELTNCLAYNPFILSDLSKGMPSLRTAIKNKKFKDLRFHGIPGGGELEGVGKCAKYTNGYITLYFAIADEAQDLVHL